MTYMSKHTASCPAQDRAAGMFSFHKIRLARHTLSVCLLLCLSGLIISLVLLRGVICLAAVLLSLVLVLVLTNVAPSVRPRMGS